MNDSTLIGRLQALQADAAPCISLYLNTQSERELGPEELSLRWRSLREQVAGAAPDKALALLDDAVDGSHRRGAGLVAFTVGEEMKLRLHLEHPVADYVLAAPLPHLVPLYEWRQDHPTYALVVVDRRSADIHVVGGLREDEIIEVEGGHDELRKVKPGGWSQRRFQQRAEDSWERNAEVIARGLDRIARDEALDLILVTGDVRAVSYLREKVSSDIAPRIHPLDSAPPTDQDLEEIRGEVEQRVAALAAGTTERILERFQEERGQGDLAADGLDATLAALRMTQVDTLLVVPDADPGIAWFSRAELTQGATDRSTLEEIGLQDLEEAPAVDVLTRLAICSGAAVRVIPHLDEEQGPAGGMGALLRFRTDTTPTT